MDRPKTIPLDPKRAIYRIESAARDAIQMSANPTWPSGALSVNTAASFATNPSECCATTNFLKLDSVAGTHPSGFAAS